MSNAGRRQGCRASLRWPGRIELPFRSAQEHAAKFPHYCRIHDCRDCAGCDARRNWIRRTGCPLPWISPVGPKQSHDRQHRHSHCDPARLAARYWYCDSALMRLGVSAIAMLASGGRNCPRSESNRHAFKGGGFSYHFGFRRPARCGFVVWSTPSPWPCGFRCPPSALYTFPCNALRGLGSASARALALQGLHRV